MGVCFVAGEGEVPLYSEKDMVTTHWVPDFDYFHSNLPPEFFMGIVLSLIICVCVCIYVYDMPVYNVSVCIYDYDLCLCDVRASMSMMCLYVSLSLCVCVCVVVHIPTHAGWSQRTTFRLIQDRVSLFLFIVVHARSAGLWASQDSPISTSHLTVATLVYMSPQRVLHGF